MEAWRTQVSCCHSNLCLKFMFTLVTSSGCHSTQASNPGKGWQLARPLPINVSHAASASLGDNMFVFGGQRSEACDDTRQV